MRRLSMKKHVLTIVVAVTFALLLASPADALVTCGAPDLPGCVPNPMFWDSGGRDHP